MSPTLVVFGVLVVVVVIVVEFSAGGSVALVAGTLFALAAVLTATTALIRHLRR